MAVVKWFGEEIKVKVDDNLNKRIKKAAIHLSNSAKKIVSGKQKTAGKGTKRRGLNPSLPGQPPKRVQGQLFRGIGWEWDPIIQTARVGTNVAHGKFLELGTSKMARRPWLSLTIVREFGAIKNILRKRI